MFCGAQRTEPHYFSGLVATMRPRSALVRVRYKGIAPHQLVTFAAAFNRRQLDQYDEVWCVVDVDEYDIDAAARTARRAGVSLVVSNPCFELWLLLHHEQCAAALPSCTDAATRLKRHVPQYDKTQLRFGDFATGVVVAVERAKQLDNGDHGWRRNPSTNVWQLVERIVAWA